MASSKGDLPLALKIGNGAFAGALGTLIVYPLDTIKGMVQNSSAKSGITQTAKKALRAGPGRLYRGVAPTLVMVAPEKAIKLGTNDAVRRAFRPDGNVTAVQGMISGGVAGLVQSVITVPMELIKLRLQLETGKGRSAAAQKPFSSPLARQVPSLGRFAAGVAPFSSVATRITVGSVGAPAPRSVVMEQLAKGMRVGQSIVAAEGVLGLYQAILPTLIRDVPFGVGFFASHGLASKWLADNTPLNPFAATLVSGLTTGAFWAGLVTPADVIKTRMQAEGGAQRYGTTANALRMTLANEGPGALFKGAVPRMLVLAPTFGLSMGFYQVMVDLYARM